MSKQAESYQNQLALLESRGLLISDKPFALHCLEHHNYYRLSPYRFPFTISGNPDQFTDGTRFEQLWSLYLFDRGLRHLVMEVCKRVEISVRSRFAYELGHQIGPLAYLENRHFHDPLIHARTLTKLHAEMDRSKELFIKHHRDVLKMPWPPIWALVEVASFGNISNLFCQIQPPTFRQSVANTYQLDEKTFCSFFHHLSVVRNIAAHHSRLWDRKLVIQFQLPQKKPSDLYLSFNQTAEGKDSSDGRIYNSMVLLIHLIQIIEPSNDWPKRLLAHIQSLDSLLIPRMGFPTDWLNLPLWQTLSKAS